MYTINLHKENLGNEGKYKNYCSYIELNNLIKLLKYPSIYIIVPEYI